MIRLPDIEAVGALMRAVAAEVVMPRFRSLAVDEVREKGPGDLVTVADLESERRFAAELPGLMPGSAVVGEEAADADPSILDALAGDGPVWLVDPVDGTANFAAGRECFALIVAYVVGGDTRAGWILDPIGDLLVTAVAGEGAWMDGRRIEIAPAKAVSAMTGSAPRRVRRRLEAHGGPNGVEVPGRLLQYRCTGREYMDMALGALDFARYGRRLKPWDHAAGLLVHAEAGGFSAVDDANAAYRPAGGIQSGALLAAPDRASWQALAGLLIATDWIAD